MNLYRKRTHELVELPAELLSFRDELWLVTRIANEPRPGSFGKVGAHKKDGERGERILYPSVFDCYIASRPAVEELADGVTRISLGPNL